MEVIDDRVTLTMEQIVKSGLPFNPVADVGGQGMPFSGQNVTRMMDFMVKNRMADPRFVSVDEARLRGWEVNGSAVTVSTNHRNPTNGSVGEKFWVNARDVVGMPTLESMQTTAKFYRLNQGALPKAEELAPVVLVPAKGTERETDVEDLQKKSNAARAALEAGADDPAVTVAKRFTVMVPYWINGVHNVEGIRLAEEISGLVHSKGLEEKEEAVESLLKASPDAKKYGLGVVDEDFKLGNHFFKTDPARPKSLLLGVLVRDDAGIYRNGKGGIKVIEDKADSLVLKNKSVEGYQAVMELAKAKGWTSIELSGKPAMMSAAWIEAQLMGIEVKNYTPTKEDQERLSVRLVPQKSREKVEPEKVEVRQFENAKQATPTTIRPTDIVNFDPRKMELVEIPPEHISVQAPVRSPEGAEAEPEAEPYELYGEEYLEYRERGKDELIEKAAAMLEHKAKVDKIETVKEGEFSGKIISIDNGIAIQKTGRSEQEVVRHKVENLSRVPAKGEVLDIKYRNGKGMVPDMDLSKAKTNER